MYVITFSIFKIAPSKLIYFFTTFKTYSSLCAFVLCLRGSPGASGASRSLCGGRGRAGPASRRRLPPHQDPSRKEHTRADSDNWRTLREEQGEDEGSVGGGGVSGGGGEPGNSWRMAVCRRDGRKSAHSTFTYMHMRSRTQLR